MLLEERVEVDVGDLGLSRPLNPLMIPKTSTRNWLARWTAPAMVALRAGVSPPPSGCRSASW